MSSRQNAFTFIMLWFYAKMGERAWAFNRVLGNVTLFRLFIVKCLGKKAGFSKEKATNKGNEKKQVPASYILKGSKTNLFVPDERSSFYF